MPASSRRWGPPMAPRWLSIALLLAIAAAAAADDAPSLAQEEKVPACALRPSLCRSILPNRHRPTVSVWRMGAVLMSQEQGWCDRVRSPASFRPLPAICQPENPSSCLQDEGASSALTLAFSAGRPRHRRRRNCCAWARWPARRRMCLSWRVASSRLSPRASQCLCLSPLLDTPFRQENRTQHTPTDPDRRTQP